MNIAAPQPLSALDYSRPLTYELSDEQPPAMTEDACTMLRAVGGLLHEYPVLATEKAREATELFATAQIAMSWIVRDVTPADFIWGRLTPDQPTSAPDADVPTGELPTYESEDANTPESCYQQELARVECLTINERVAEYQQLLRSRREALESPPAHPLQNTEVRLGVLMMAARGDPMAWDLLRRHPLNAESLLQ